MPTRRDLDALTDPAIKALPEAMRHPQSLSGRSAVQGSPGARGQDKHELRLPPAAVNPNLLHLRCTKPVRERGDPGTA